MFNASSPTVTNCAFFGNSATSGGGMFNAASLTLTNCTFFGNSATTGGGILHATLPLSVTNCILWGNQATNSGNQIHNLGATINISYTMLEGGIAAIGNTGTVNDNGNNSTADPLFVNAASGNLRLQACSPAINTGSNAAVPSGITTDLDGNPRFYNSGVVDMGAYEYQGNPTPAPIPPPITTNNGLNFDGANDYVEISACGAATPLINGGDAITIEYWFKGSNNQSAVRLQNNNDHYIVAGWYGQHILSNDGGILDGIPVGAAATDGNWHHIAMTWQRNTANGFKSYLDGQLVAQRNSSDNPLPAIPTGWYLGANGGTVEFMNGTLDEVRIWNVARTQAQIQASLYGLSLPQAGLLAYYQFDHGSAGSNNAGIAAVANSANAGAYTGELKNFALNGATSNWAPAAPSAPLPVEMLFFRASNEGGRAKLTWATASEVNADRFEVEHSTDGLSFLKIGEVKANGHSTVKIDYSFLHSRLFSGKNYYRLRQVDFDGQFEYSHIVSVEMEHKGSGLHFFPNPATGTVNIALETGHTGEATLTLYDLSGKPMKTQTLPPAGGVLSTTVDVSGLPGGVYLLDVRAGHERWRERLVVARAD